MPGAQGAPETSPWLSAAGYPGRPTSGRSRLGIIAIGIVGVVVAGVIAAVVLLPKGPAKIVFTTTQPAQGSSCDVKDTVDHVKAGTDVWMLINFQSKMDETPITVSVTKNGESLGDYPYDVSKTKGWGCIYDEHSLADFPAGTYVFTAHHGDHVEAEGTLVIE
jgi:hypothetical protein